LDTGQDLTDKDKAFLKRVANRRSLFLVFSVLTVLVAAAFLLYHALVAKDLNGQRLLIVLLLLLSGRSHLRQYRISVILAKAKERLMD